MRDRVGGRELDIVQVKGKQAPTRIFEILGVHPLPPEPARRAAEFERGLVAYRGREWAKAIAAFTGLLDRAPRTAPPGSTSTAHGGSSSHRHRPTGTAST